MKTIKVIRDAGLALSEAMCVLVGLRQFDFLARRQKESSDVVALRMRLEGLLARYVDAVPTTDRKATLGECATRYEDGEVLGFEAGAVDVILWNGDDGHAYNSGETLLNYGIGNLREHELVRVGVSREQWRLAQLALKGDRARPDGWTRNVYMRAQATGYGSSPSFAKLVVDAQFLELLLRLKDLSERERLTEVRVSGGPEQWGGLSDIDDLQLQCAELVVTCNSFWFTDSPKHSDETFQTTNETIEAFVEKVLEGEGDLYLADDVQDLKDAVNDFNDDSDDDGTISQEPSAAT